MGKGETDYEIWEVETTVSGFIVPMKSMRCYDKLAVCDTQANALKKLSKIKWPKNGLAIIPVRRKK